MDQQPASRSRFTGPLWVVAIALLILSLGVGLIAYILWMKKEEAGSPQSTQAEKAFAVNGRNPRKIVKHPPEIFGRVVLRGSPPPELLLPLDPLCRKYYTTEPLPTTQFYAVGEEGGLWNVVVYLEGDFAATNFPTPAKPVTIETRGCVFRPYVTAARTGQTIVVRNTDSILYNIHPTPVNPGNREFNYATLPRSKPVEFRFDFPELFLRIKSDVHPWMFCYLSVFSHPFFAITDSNGFFHIPPPPPGSYRLIAKHRKSGEQERLIEFKSDEALREDFEFDPTGSPAASQNILRTAAANGGSPVPASSTSVAAAGSSSTSPSRREIFLLPAVGARTPELAPSPGSTPAIIGHVRLRGTPPPEKPIVMDPGCGRLQTNGAPTTRFYVVGADSGLADVVVSIQSGNRMNEAFIRATGTRPEFPIPAEPLMINQVGCEYFPYVAAARAGQAILVHNSDPLLHNVHATPAVQGNAESNRAHLPGAAPLQFVFPKAESFLRFKCDVHPWMFAYVSLFDHAYFTVSYPDGLFAMPLPPPGRYVLEAIHRKAGRVSKEIVVEAGRGIQLDFELEVQ